MCSQTAMRRRTYGSGHNRIAKGQAFPQVNPGVVGLAGLEPAASSLSEIDGWAPCFSSGDQHLGRPRPAAGKLLLEARDWWVLRAGLYADALAEGAPARVGGLVLDRQDRDDRLGGVGHGVHRCVPCFLDAPADRMPHHICRGGRLAGHWEDLRPPGRPTTRLGSGAAVLVRLRPLALAGLNPVAAAVWRPPRTAPGHRARCSVPRTNHA